MRRIVWDEGLFRVLKRALQSTDEDRARLDEEGKSKGKGKGKSKRMREGSWTGAITHHHQHLHHRTTQPHHLLHVELVLNSFGF